VNDLIKVAATSFVPVATRDGEAACVRRTAPPVWTHQWTGLPVNGPVFGTLDRTRLPFAGIATPLGAVDLGDVMGADQVPGTAVRIPAAVAAQGTPPPRRSPSRC
jgi:hypothetical protein